MPVLRRQPVFKTYNYRELPLTLLVIRDSWNAEKCTVIGLEEFKTRIWFQSLLNNGYYIVEQSLNSPGSLLLFRKNKVFNKEQITLKLTR